MKVVKLNHLKKFGKGKKKRMEETENKWQDDGLKPHHTNNHIKRKWSKYHLEIVMYFGC